MNADHPKALAGRVDAVVMLTWSNWHQEMRGNRYHYATRFANELPVIFVQADLMEPYYRYEATDRPNLSILHLWNRYDDDQIALLNEALTSRGIIQPILWIYNFRFVEFVARRHAALKIYHATEDYFYRSFFDLTPDDLQELRRLLSFIDLLISVSDGVNDSYVQHGGYAGDSVVAANGCDFKFWAPDQRELHRIAAQRRGRIALYQGGISHKLDFDLLDHTVRNLSDWEFWFCGDHLPHLSQWDALRRRSNIRYLGKISVEEVRACAYQASVGLIPFVRDPWLYEKAFPLKAFEYAACGLPTVSIPLKNLEPYPEVFHLASSSEQFVQTMRAVEPTSRDVPAIARRLQLAAGHDYDQQFSRVCARLLERLQARPSTDRPLNIGVLYDDRSMHVNTIRDHLDSFRQFSRHRVFYAVATNDLEPQRLQDPDIFLCDVIILHYSVRVSQESHLVRRYAEAFRRFGGLKILFIQDEYDWTELARTWIAKLGIHVVYTCVPKDYRESVYPSSRFPHVEFVHTLTGYVPLDLHDPRRPLKPLAERKYMIGYRGRELPYWYGDLGREKLIIGQRMRELCEARGIPCDIDWTAESRIYGPQWYEFLGDCRATLGTESGSNVFDFDGELHRQIGAALARSPAMSYADVHARYLAAHEGRIVMNQISPKVFEAIALRTALVLFEGSYSGVIQPNIHYIPLKKDFSNVEEVFLKLHDEVYLSDITKRAYDDIVRSGQYSYRRFVQECDELISRRLPRGNDVELVSGIIAVRRGGDPHVIRGIVQDGQHLSSRATMAPCPRSLQALPPEHPLNKIRSIIKRVGRKLQKYPLLFRYAHTLYYWTRRPFYRWLNQRTIGRA